MRVTVLKDTKLNVLLFDYLVRYKIEHDITYMAIGFSHFIEMILIVNFYG